MALCVRARDAECLCPAGLPRLACFSLNVCARVAIRPEGTASFVLHRSVELQRFISNRRQHYARSNSNPPHERGPPHVDRFGFLLLFCFVEWKKLCSYYQSVASFDAGERNGRPLIDPALVTPAFDQAAKVSGKLTVLIDESRVLAAMKSNAGPEHRGPLREPG